jgi:nucleoside triphosphate pyrophosphatase
MRFKQQKNIILASGSPRRKAYLERYQLDFEIRKAEIDESSTPEDKPLEFSERMALEKAQVVMQQCGPNDVVIAADTIVVLDGEIIGKPASHEDVFPMLKKLNGETHEVITSYVVISQNGLDTIKRSVHTKVIFNRISDNMLRGYANSKEPLDKAGAYSIQGLGTLLVQSIEGSYNNVVGLPIECLLQDLVKIGVISINQDQHPTQ